LAGCAPYIEAEAGKPSSWVAGAGRGVYHRVEAGETLWRIARTYGVDMDALLAANRWMDARRIEVGQQVFIPQASEVRPVPPSRGGGSSSPGEAGPSAFVPTEDFIWPLKGRVISFFGTWTAHGPNKGLDIQAPAGTVVRVARFGRVSFLEASV